MEKIGGAIAPPAPPVPAPLICIGVGLNVPLSFTKVAQRTNTYHLD